MSAAIIAAARRSRLAEAMAEEGVDLLVVYGNAWQGDYLRYATDYGILEGEGLAIVRRDGTTTLFLDSPLEADRAAVETPGIETIYAPAMLAEVEALLERAGNSRIGTSPEAADAAASRVAFERFGHQRPDGDDGPSADEEARLRNRGHARGGTYGR